MNPLSHKITSCETLDELYDLLCSIPAEETPHDNTLTSLPTYGGAEPTRTDGVWSWDETRLIVGESKFAIEPRCACGEASFHCRCGVTR